MDYGKLAYLKAEDLERMVGRLNKKQSAFSGTRTCYEIGRTIDGRYKVTDVRGGGDGVALIIKFYASAEKKTFLDLLIGGKTAARQTIGTDGREYIMLVKTKIPDSAELVLNASGVFVERLELMLIGGAAGYGGRQLNGDFGGGRALVVDVTDETIGVFDGEENGVDAILNKKTEAMGRAADACFIRGRFYMLILDLYGNLWLRDYSGDGRYKFLGNGDNGAALAESAGGLCAATIKNETGILYDLDSFADKATEEIAETVTDAVSLKFAKGSGQPVLAAKNKNGGSSFVIAEREVRTGDTVGITIRASAS